MRDALFAPQPGIAPEIVPRVKDLIVFADTQIAPGVIVREGTTIPAIMDYRFPVTQQPTPLNKATLLSDATAALYGLGTDAVPNDVLARIRPMIPNTRWQKIMSYETAGAVSWVPPDLIGNGTPYAVGVFLIGGGASGGICPGSESTMQYYSASGGASGYTRAAIITVTPGVPVTGVVGAGGAVSVTSVTTANNAPGGTTSFGGYTASGGGADKIGAVSPDAIYNQFFIAGRAPKLGESSNPMYSNGFMPGNRSYPTQAYNPFELVPILGAGGNAGCYNNSVTLQTTDTLPDGKKAGAGASGRTGNNATSPGCGGGALTLQNAGTISPSLPASAGSGAAGAIYIYGRIE